MVRRIGSFVALLLVATFVLAACGTEDKGTEPTVTRVSAEGAPEPTVPGEEAQASAQAPAPSGEAAGPPVTIDVKLVDIQFEPNQITVPANSAVTVNLTNAGAASHTFTIDELGVDSGEIAPQGTGTVTFNSGTPAEYEFYCKVPGHKEAGMVGKLVVTAGPVGSAASPSPAGGEAATPAAAGSPAAAAATPDAAVSPASTPAAMGGAASPVTSLVASPAAQTTSGAQTTFDVSLVDIAFEPTELTVQANTEITINLTNNGLAPHTFDIDALGVDSGEIPPGGTGTVTFNSGAPGTYEFYCKVPGHKEAGMVGTLIVQ